MTRIVHDRGILLTAQLRRSPQILLCLYQTPENPATRHKYIGKAGITACPAARTACFKASIKKNPPFFHQCDSFDLLASSICIYPSLFQAHFFTWCQLIMVRRVANQIRLISLPSAYSLMRGRPDKKKKKNVQNYLCSRILHFLTSH